jgi:hypothetical protein
MPLPSLYSELFGKQDANIPKFVPVDPGSSPSGPSTSMPKPNASSDGNDMWKQIGGLMGGSLSGILASLLGGKQGNPQAAYGGANGQDRNWQANWAQQEGGMPSSNVYKPDGGLYTGLESNNPFQLNAPQMDWNRAQFSFEDIGIIPDAMAQQPSWSSTLFGNQPQSSTGFGMGPTWSGILGQ